jgi:Putative transmembrane protein (PGPGW)
MRYLEAAWDWSDLHDPLLWWLFAASLIMLLATPVLVGWMLVQLPADYFASPRRRTVALWERRHPWWLAIVMAKNLIGIVLVLAGVVMLFTPGQGLLTIVLGILLVDFPGKHRLRRWLVTRPGVWRSINSLRERAGREPFQSP